MQNINTSTATDCIEMRSLSDCEEEQLVIFELVVPIAAKVPALSQPVAIGRIVQPATITSTVPAPVMTPLWANNTANSLAWFITPTLAATREPARLTLWA